MTLLVLVNITNKTNSTIQIIISISIINNIIGSRIRKRIHGSNKIQHPVWKKYQYIFKIYELHKNMFLSYISAIYFIRKMNEKNQQVLFNDL